MRRKKTYFVQSLFKVLYELFEILAVLQKEREREFMNNLLSYLYMHGQRRNGRKFCPEKVKYSKGEM